LKNVKAPRFKLTVDEVKPVHENALELFYSGIKSAETRRTMDGNLKRFLVDACSEILHGDYKERAVGNGNKQSSSLNLFFFYEKISALSWSSFAISANSWVFTPVSRPLIFVL
jgi:hypothetical protein